MNVNQLAPIELSEALPLVKVPAKPTMAQKKAMVEAAAFAKFGVHALRVKTKVLAQLGKEAEGDGIKHLGNGKVIVASGHAEDAIARLGSIADKLAAVEKPDFALIIEVLRLQREFNAQLITTAQVHLNVAKTLITDQPPSLTVAFPAGTPLLLASGKAPL